MNLIRLSFNLLRRDWRAGEWRVLLLALVLAVGSLATVGLFADRVRQALSQQAAGLLGADLRITSTRPISDHYRKMAVLRSLRVVQSRSFPSMVSHHGKVLLSEIQAVEAGYPLRGNIMIDDGHVHVAQTIPVHGTVWADERLMRRLDLRTGDEVGIGTQKFIVAARITRDVDQSIGFASFAPRVLMNEADVAATGLLQEGSRVAYRMMIAGDAKQIVTLRKALPLNNNERLEDVKDARPEIRTALERAEHFLGLASLSTAILAGVAILLAARRYVARHLDGCAVMRCLGAKQEQVLKLFMYQFLLAGLFAVLAGLLLAYVTQALLVNGIMPDANLPQPGAIPAVKAAASGFALLFGFAFLPLLQLGRVSPLRVMRREIGSPQMSGWLIYGAAALVLSLLFLWQAGTVRLGFSVLGGLLSGLLIFGILAWLLLGGLAYVASIGGVTAQAFNNLARHSRSVAVQVVMLSLGGMALLVLTLVRGDLLQSWQGKLPPDTPNRFVVSIQPDQQQAVQEFFAKHQLPELQLLPMVKGRLVAINQRAISGADYPEPRARGLVEREFNLSYADKLPAWNKLSQGRWWSQGSDASQLSVEEGIAKTLGIKLGDVLTFDVAGSRFAATVTSLRLVQWDSMRVNFFVIATPGVLKNYPASYLASFYLPPEKISAGDELVREFPNLLVIDTDAVITQIRDIIAKVSQTISVVFVFTLLCGIVVLYAALLSTQDERVQEAAILRTLGADSAYLRRLHLAEFAAIGLLAGLFSAGSAVLLGYVLARYVLDIPYQSGAEVWLTGALGGMALVMLAGWLNTRRLSKVSPLLILRGE